MKHFDMASNILRAFLKYRILFFIILISSSVTKAQWREINKGNDDQNEINGVSFINPSTGFLATTKYIGFTSDSGHSFVRRNVRMDNIDFNNFSAVNLTFGFYIAGVHAFSPDSLLTFGHFGTEPGILFSANQGQTWKLVFHKRVNQYATFFNEGITDMKFQGSTGFAVHDEAVLKTNNRGQTWNVSLDLPYGNLGKLSYPSTGHLFVVGGKKLFKSTNAGASWSDISIPVENSFDDYNKVFFLDNDIGYIMKSNKVYKTERGGLLWTQMNDERLNGVNGSDLHFINDSTGFLSADGVYDVWKTSDNGKTWEICKRNSNHSYLAYGLNDLFFYNDKIAWTGGGKEYLMINTTGLFPTLPRALFKIDTSDVGTTGRVKLVNFSKKNYQYQWYKNGTLISNTYNPFYFHDPYKALDTIQLIVYNGSEYDTSTLYQLFDPVINNITSFSPVMGTNGTLVTITGTNFSGVTAVRFGGQPASGFTVVSPTQIEARVSSGATGSVSVVTTLGTGAMPGFTYLGLPSANLPMTIDDSILCKSGSVTITISNSEMYTQYELMDSLSKVLGIVPGNGGPVSITSIPLTQTGRYAVRASRTNGNSYVTLARKFFVLVEHTTSLFESSRVNITAAEKVTYTATSREASSLAWTLDGDASITSSTQPTLTDVSYSSTGQKALTLISTSINGCRDTIKGDATHVYSKPSATDVCYVQNISDQDLTSRQWSPQQMSNVTVTKDNGYVICGGGNNLTLKSRYGASKKFKGPGVAYVAKYTTDGILSWVGYINGQGAKGTLNASAQDSDGNIYVVGFTWVHSYFHFANGDSVKIAATSFDIKTYGDKLNGFVLKLDAAGNYLWHTVLADPSSEIEGYPTGGGLPSKIKIVGNQVLIEGSFLANMAYCRNGVNQILYTLRNSTSAQDLQNNFILKIKQDGSFSWTAYFHNDTNNYFGRIYDIGLDANGNSFVTGVFEEKTIVHDAQNSTTTFTGYVAEARSYLLKFDPLGRLIWKVTIQPNRSNRDVAMYALAVDAAGNSYITGDNYLQNQNEYIQITNSNGSTRNFNVSPYCLLKFDPQGINAWTVGSRDTASTAGLGKTILLKDGDVYVTGELYGNGPAPLTFTMTSSDSTTVALTMTVSEFFIIHYDTAGVLKRAVRSGENVSGNVRTKDVVIDHENNFIVSGTAGIRNGSSDTLRVFNSVLPSDGSDGFFAKLNPNFCYPGIVPIANAGVDKTRCAGDTATIGIQATGESYSWTSKPVGFISSLSNPVVRPNVTTSYYLTVTNKGGLIAKDTVLVNVLSPVAKAGADTTICAGSGVSIGATGITDYTYSWSSNPVGFVSSTANPAVNPSLVTTYFLTVTNSLGCMGKDTVTITVNGMVLPTVSIVSGNLPVCQGSDITFTATPVNAGLNPNYQWSVNGINVGANSNTYTSALNDNDQVKVSLTTTAGCSNGLSATSNVIAVKAGNKQKVLGQASAPVALCTNESFTVSFKSANVPPGSEIKLWEGTSNNSFALKSTQIYNGTDLSFTVNSNAVATLLNYFFTITPASGSCLESGNSDTTTVQVEKLDLPVIASSNKVLTLINPDITASYKWQVQRNAVWNDVNPAAQGPSYTAMDTGSYRIRADKRVCTQYSAAVNVAADSLVISESKNIYIYPNPTTGKLTIDSLNLSDHWVMLNIINMGNGQNVASYNITGKTYITLDLTALPPGIYLTVFIKNDGTIYYKKFMKL